MTAATADYAVRIVDDVTEADLSVVLTDANGDVVMNAADCTGGGGPTHDYTPYELDASATAIAAVVAGLTPFAYYPMNNAVGAADQSGNGHDATAQASVSYAAAPLSTKNVAGQSVSMSPGGSITLPPPVADMASPASAWAAAMLIAIDAYDSGVGGSGPFSFWNWAPAAGSPPKIMFGVTNTGQINALTDSSFSRTAVTASTDVFFGLGDPHVLILNAPVGSPARPIEWWIDGVLVFTCINDGTGTAADTFTLGRSADHFFGAHNVRMSDVSTYAHALTRANIAALTEAMADEAIFAGAWTP